MRIIDISMPIYTGMIYYPGDPGARIEPVLRIAQGDIANLSALTMGTHAGTHVDAPHHFEGGPQTVDRMPLEVLVGPARVVDLTGVQGFVSAGDLEEAGVAGAKRLLIKTTNSRLLSQPDFTADYVSLADDAADLLVERGVRLVGIDYLSIERFKSKDYHVHHTLLGAGVAVLEAVDLSEVQAGDYELVCLPLKIQGGDGAPARAVIIER